MGVPVPMQADAIPSPVPTAVPLGVPTAVPLGEAVPVAMPLSTAAAETAVPFGEAVPVAMPGSTAAILRFPCCAEKYEQLKAMIRADAPYALARRGMTREAWAHCADALEAVHDASFFKNCPDCEGVYWCVPLGPLSFFLCLINPISCVFCIHPVEQAKRACIAKCTPILQPLGYKVSAPTFDLDDAVVFEPA